MRLQSHIFVSGFLRAQQAKGGFGAIARKGSPEAGAVFIVHNRLDGRFCLYGPAPLSFFDDAQDFSRMFEIVLQDAQESEIANFHDEEAKMEEVKEAVHGQPAYAKQAVRSEPVNSFQSGEFVHFEAFYDARGDASKLAQCSSWKCFVRALKASVKASLACLESGGWIIIHTGNIRDNTYLLTFLLILSPFRLTDIAGGAGTSTR